MTPESRESGNHWSGYQGFTDRRFTGHRFADHELSDQFAEHLRKLSGRHSSSAE
ncbi:hypothetical protein AB0395_18045 [Streptosporangium sp. NPDC051023]|uniref:hypothetical protein n=1 Tax=Streptosporangium sp. NPDC051023 TaxID=3155410 RepID=UPI00344BCB56